MSWCDKLASTPAAGLTLDPHITASGLIVDKLAPILQPLHAPDILAFSVDQQDALNIQLTTNDGYIYGIDPARIHVTFTYRLRARATSGGPPVMEMLSKAEPFTTKLPVVLDRLVAATLLLPNIPNRNVRKVGIVALTHVDEADIPPGIAKFVEFLARPWAGRAVSFETSITTVLNDGEGVRDRCVHILKKPEDRAELMTLQFDWQREFIEPKPVNQRTLQLITEGASESALAYFESLAEGVMFDEALLSNPA